MCMIRRLICAIPLSTMVFLGVIRPDIIALTNSGYNRKLYDVGLPGIAIGKDVTPVKAGQAGYLEAWWFPHTADDIKILVVIPRVPALPAPPNDTIEV